MNIFKKKVLPEIVAEALGRECSNATMRSGEELEIDPTQLKPKSVRPPRVMDLNELRNESYAGKFREGQRLLELPRHHLGGVATKWCYLAMNKDLQYGGLAIEVGPTPRSPEVGFRKRTLQ
jgi:hypothetical protein